MSEASRRRAPLRLATPHPRATAPVTKSRAIFCSALSPTASSRSKPGASDATACAPERSDTERETGRERERERERGGGGFMLAGWARSWAGIGQATCWGLLRGLKSSEWLRGFQQAMLKRCS